MSIKTKQNIKSDVIDLGSENPVEIAMVIDVSGSMGNESKLQLTQAASSKLIKLMRLHKDSLGICSFSNSGNIEWANSQHQTRLLESGAVQAQAIGAVRKLTADGGTDMLKGLELAAKMFTSRTSNKAVILLSDGRDNHTVGEKQLARDLNNAQKEVYTVAIGKDADHPLLEELAGNTARYNLVSKPFAINKVFNKIIGQLGIAHVLFNEIKELSSDQFYGSIYPQVQTDNTIPAGKTEVVVAIAWDQLDHTCEYVNTLALLREKQISFSIGKMNSGSLVPPDMGNLTVLHKEAGTVVVKISGVNAGEQYGVEMEKYYDSTDTIRFSVGVFA